MSRNIHPVTEFNNLEGLNLWICMCSKCIHITAVRINNMHTAVNTINYSGLHVKCPMFLSHFNQIWDF